MKDVAWLEDVQLIFLIFHRFVCKFARADNCLVRGKKCTDKCLGNLKKKKKCSVTSSTATSFKLGEYNLLSSILMLRFRNCVKFNFGRSCLPSDSHTNTVISDRLTLPTRQDGVENCDRLK